MNEKMTNTKDLRVELIYPLDETKKASYKITSHDEISFDDFFEASDKLNIDNEILDVFEVTTNSGIVVRFELDKIKEMKNDKRWIFEWYDGEYIENEETGNVELRRIGKIHREVFGHKEDLLNRYAETMAISGQVYDIVGFYECSLNLLTEDDIAEMDEFDEEVDED